AATPLTPELFQRHPLDVVANAERQHALFVRDEVLFAEVLCIGLDDFRPPHVAVLLLDLQRILFNKDVNLVWVRQEVLEVRNLRLDLVEFRLQSLPLQCRQPPQLHVEDGPRLYFGEGERVGPRERRQCPVPCRQPLRDNEPGALQQVERILRRIRCPDGCYDRVQHLDRLQQPFEDVRPLLSLLKLVFRPPLNHVVAVRDEQLQRFLQHYPPRRTVRDHHHVDRER